MQPNHFTTVKVDIANDLGVSGFLKCKLGLAQESAALFGRTRLLFL